MLPVLSGSMAPCLPVGGSVRVLPSSWRQCRRGDIVVFREAAKVVAHRCLWRLRVPGGCWLFQKGDCDTFGHLIDGRQVVGVVTEAWDADGVVTYRRAAGPIPRRELRRHRVRELRARLLIGPRALKRLAQRAVQRVLER